MSRRNAELAAIATILAACSQGQPGPSSAPESPSYASRTGALACDEYLALASACIEKGRFGAATTRRVELALVERTLRDLASGLPTAVEPTNVWASALHAARVERRLELSRAEMGTESKHPDDAVDRPPVGELCKRAIDQLPAGCQ